MITSNFILTGRGGIDFAMRIEVPTAADLLKELETLQLSLFQAGSATITPEKQAAAIASTAAGKAAKAEKPAKVETKAPETPVEALKQAVADEKAAEPTKPARTYETSGLAEKIAKGAAKDKPATIALLTKHKALNTEGKPNGKFLPVDAFDAFEADIDALLAPPAEMAEMAESLS